MPASMPPKKDRTAEYRSLEASSPTFRLKQRILRRTLSELSDPRPRRSWDAGCGAGTLSAIVAAYTTAELLVTDIEDSSVASTLTRLKTGGRLAIRGCVVDLERDTAPAGGFDFILCWAVLEHLADDTRGMATLAGALAPGGRLVINVPLHPRLMNALDHLEDHHRRYTRRSLTALIEGAGLRLASFRTFGFPGLLATKVLWAPFVRHEATVASSPVSRIASRVIAAADFAAFHARIPLGVEALAVAMREEPVQPLP